MRALFVSSYRQMMTRGASRATAGLSAFLRREGWEVEETTPSRCHDFTHRDLLVWSGPTFNQGIIDTLYPKKAILWRHGDESLQDYPIGAIVTGRAYLCLPSAWACQHLGWNVPCRALYPAFEPPPAAIPPRGSKWLYVGAFEPGKNLQEALVTAHKYPDEQFIFRGNEGKKRGRQFELGWPNVQWGDYTESQEELWDDVKGLFLPSLFETFSILAYEAMSRGLPVWIPKNAMMPIGYRENSVFLSLNSWSVVCPIGEPNAIKDAVSLRDAMIRTHETAKAQLREMLEE